MDSERVLISRPLPRAKLRLIQVAGGLTLALVVGGFFAYVLNETEVNAAVAALPFGPEDAGAGVLPVLGLPILFFVLLLARYSRRYGSCELVPGALLLRPLWGPGERGAVVPVLWAHVVRLEELAETVRLEFRGGTSAHVPTTDPSEIRLLLRLHEEALEGPQPVHFSLRPSLVTAALGCAHASWLLLFWLLTLGLTLKGIARFAPTLATEAPAPELLLLPVFVPLLSWFGRVPLPKMLGTEHALQASEVEVVRGGLHLGPHYFPFEGLRVFPVGNQLALERGEARHLVTVGEALPELLAALEPYLEAPPGEPPDWVVTDRAQGYRRATLFLSVLVALQCWFFLA